MFAIMATQKSLLELEVNMNSPYIPEAYNRPFSLLFYLLCFMQMTFFSVFFNPQLAAAANVSFQWDENIEADLAGYMIHYGTSSGIYTSNEDVGNQTTYALSGLEEGNTYYFALTAYNTQLAHSDFSVELSKYIPESDTDQDGLTDNDETSIYNTDPNNPDTDGDGINDGDEVAFWGSDWGKDFDNDGSINLLDSDSDGDGYSDGVEMTEGSDPSNPDSTPLVIVDEETTILEVDFDLGEEDFVYLDDVFLGTYRPKYANGAWSASGGFVGGGLQVTLGGIDNEDILDMSGGWKKVFTLNNQTEVILSFHYNLTQSSDYESDEFSQVLVSIDGVLYGQASNDFVDEIAGDGNGGNPQTTGWRLFQINPGTLSDGDHTLIIGGYNNKKTYGDEITQILIDDVLVTSVVDYGENLSPVADDQAVTTAKNTTMSVTLTAVDPDGDSLTYSIVTDPTNGLLNGTAPSLTYTPHSDYIGEDTFTFKANDGLADSNVATVSITITSVNENPVAIFSCVCDGLICTFDASQSYDSDGFVEHYSWDFGDSVSGSGETITHTYQASGTYNASLTVTDDDGATHIAWQNVNVTEPSQTTTTIEPTYTMHVGDLDGKSVNLRNHWKAEVTITVNDTNENPVKGAIVSGIWSGGTEGERSCTTDELGQCLIASRQIHKKIDEAVFTVGNISHDALTYVAADNWDPDEDSDGSTIRVYKP